MTPTPAPLCASHHVPARGRTRRRLAGNGPPDRATGAPNRAERRAYVRRTCGFPNLFDRAGLLPGWHVAA